MRFVFTYPCDNGKVGVEAVLFYIFCTNYIYLRIIVRFVF
jgi:hypothetical protein